MFATLQSVVFPALLRTRSFIFARWVGMVDDLIAPEHVVVSGKRLTGSEAPSFIADLVAGA